MPDASTPSHSFFSEFPKVFSTLLSEVPCKRRLNNASDTSRLRTYFCDECKAWHMTSSFH